MRRFLFFVFILLFVPLISILVFGVILYTKWSLIDLPSRDEILNYRPPLVTEVYDRNGKLIAEFFVERRIYLTIDKIPDRLKKAFLAAEDARFYEHKGIDIKGIIRALIIDIKERKFVQGGSTITQQVAKNMFLTPEKTISRKIKEAILAMKLEKILSKDKILELYLNQIYFGHSSYGVEAAAQTYFGKHVSELTTAECALLAAVTKAPGKYSPFINLKAAYARRNYILKRMYEEGFISRKEYIKAKREKIVLNRKRIKRVDEAPYFNEFIRTKLIEKYGLSKVLKGGLRVYTTLDLKANKIAQEALRRGLIDIEVRNGRIPKDSVDTRVQGIIKEVYDYTVTVDTPYGEVIIPASEFYNSTVVPEPGDRVFVWSEGNGTLWHLWHEPEVQGALLSVDLNNMGIIAMVGGYDFKLSKFNRTYQAKRQPGSAFKAVVYTTAVEYGYTPYTIVLDAPVVYENRDVENDSERFWIPQNFDKKFLGPIPFWRALALSRNTVSVRLTQKLGIDRVIRTAKRLGITSSLRRDLSIALGSSELSPWELLRTYTVFAKGGKLCNFVYITKVTDYDGKILEMNNSTCERVIDEDVANTMLFLLRKVVETGTGKKARVLPRPAAGKTGTTDNYKDAWFVGFTPNVATVVFVGYDDNKSLGKWETGSRAALPIWVSYMMQVTKDYPFNLFPPYVEFGFDNETIPSRQEFMYEPENF